MAWPYPRLLGICSIPFLFGLAKDSAFPQCPATDIFGNFGSSGLYNLSVKETCATQNCQSPKSPNTWVRYDVYY